MSFIRQCLKISASVRVGVGTNFQHYQKNILWTNNYRNNIGSHVNFRHFHQASCHWSDTRPQHNRNSSRKSPHCNFSKNVLSTCSSNFNFCRKFQKTNAQNHHQNIQLAGKSVWTRKFPFFKSHFISSSPASLSPCTCPSFRRVK